MTIKNAAVLIILYFSDLQLTAKTKEFITLADFEPEVVKACDRPDVDVILYEDESSNRHVLAYNNSLDTEAESVYEVLEEDVVSEEN